MDKRKQVVIPGGGGGGGQASARNSGSNAYVYSVLSIRMRMGCFAGCLRSLCPKALQSSYLCFFYVVLPVKARLKLLLPICE
jgi:hypothetical protein